MKDYSENSESTIEYIFIYRKTGTILHTAQPNKQRPC